MNCLIRILFCAAVLIAAYFAFVNAQAETAGKPARTRWIHVLISIGFALTASLMFTKNVFYPDVYSGSPQIAWNHLIAPAVIGVVVYFGFSWITLRSFKSAVKRLMFFPVVLAGVAIVLLCSAAMTSASEKSKFAQAISNTSPCRADWFLLRVFTRSVGAETRIRNA